MLLLVFVFQFLLAIVYSPTDDPVFVNVTLEVVEPNAPLDITIEGDSSQVSVDEDVSPEDIVLRFSVTDPNSQTNSPTTISVQLHGEAACLQFLHVVINMLY